MSWVGGKKVNLPPTRMHIGMKRWRHGLRLLQRFTSPFAGFRIDTTTMRSCSAADATTTIPV